jgi:site-specific DNA-methyltransferase (adenine-specific)
MPASFEHVRSTNHLYYGENLAILREHIRDESIDLIYLDPPFNSQATYNILFRAPTGEHSQAQIEAFEDTWHWNETAEHAFDEVLSGSNSRVTEILRALRSVLHESDMMAYLTMMAVRLVQLHRVLKPTGSLYLHCDPTASHYLKLVMDAVFEPFNFKNEIIWKRTSAHNSAKRWGPIHDTLLFYTRSDRFTWNRAYQEYDPHYTDTFYRYKDSDGRRFTVSDLTGAGKSSGSSGASWRQCNPTTKGRHWAIPRHIPGIENIPVAPIDALEYLDNIGRIYWPKKQGGIPRFKRYLDDMEGVLAQDIIEDIPPLSPQDRERLGYPTQKPLALLERIIQASSNANDIVLDPFCGCGTAIHAAQKLGRQWLGIDITHLAISLIEKRLNDVFPGLHYEVHGTPKDLEGAKALADFDKYQFQWWAVSLVNAVPYGGKKKGADTGIDGLIYFKPDGKQSEKAIVSVKGGGNISVLMIRDLAYVVEREHAKIGVFLTLTPPTRPMQLEATKAGFYNTPYHGNVPKIQIYTIAELLGGRKPQIPFVDPTTFRRAPQENTIQQPRLL